MFAGIALPWSGLPLEMLEEPDLARRAYERGGEREVQFLFRDHTPVLPVWHEGRLRTVVWGNRRRGGSRRLPCTGWTWLSTFEAGGWAGFGPMPVDVPAMMGLENGVWYQIREGIRGLLVTDERGTDRVFLLCEPSTYYYRVMTRSDWMPVLIGERF
jgi:hypothetical protein